MRVTYCTRVVQKTICLLFLLKISKGLKFILHHSENKSWNFKTLQQSGMHSFFWATFSLRNNDTVLAQHPPQARQGSQPQLFQCQSPSRSPGLGSSWCFPGWGLWKVPVDHNSPFPLIERCCHLSAHILLDWGQIPLPSSHFKKRLKPLQLKLIQNPLSFSKAKIDA